MPRPRTISDEALLDAVLSLAHRVGPAKLTLAAAAAEVGLSPATLVQRFGTKRALLLAADRRGVEHWVGAVAGVDAADPLTRIVEGLAAATDGVTDHSEMANSVALLQMALDDPDFHAGTLAGAREVRAIVRDRLVEAHADGLLHGGVDVDALAKQVETTYHGSMIAWAIHRDGALSAWIREQVEAVLAPWRSV